MKRYLVIPGYITSKTDGDLHYIGAAKLLKLYGVTLEECVIWDKRFPCCSRPDDLIVLEPRYDGDYSLPDKVE